MWLDGFGQDVRYALRSYIRSPIFALTAVLSIAIGVGADTTVFTLANALLLREPGRVRAFHELVAINGIDDDDRFGINEVSFPTYTDLRERVTTLTDVYGYAPVSQPMSLTVGGAAERLYGHRVTPNYFAALGVGAAVGRVFDPSVSSTDAVVLSHRYWVQRFGSDPAVVGATVALNSRPATIVGIAAEGFTGTSIIATDVWVPLDMVPFEGSYLTRRDLGWALAGARLKPGATLAQAAAELDAIAATLARDHPETAGRGLHAARASMIPGNLSVPLAGVLTLVLGFVSLVLVIACANLAGLLLTRAAARRQEIAIRVAIGAGRARVIRQLLTEVALLFAMAAVGAVALTFVVVRLIEKLLPMFPVPLGVSLTIDARVLTFTAGVSLLAALVCGLVPARQSSGWDVVSALKDAAPGATGRSRLQNASIIGQVAASVVLIAASVLFLRALNRAASIDPGFDPSGVELASLDLSLARYTPMTGTALLRELVRRVRELPSVTAASVAALLPTEGAARYGILTHPGADPRARGRPLAAEWNVVEPGYFGTLRIPVIRGRDFTEQDASNAERVVIVSQTAAARFWPGRDPIGQVLLLHPTEFRRGQANETHTLRVIGVVGDLRVRPRDTSRAHVYLPLQQFFVPSVTIAARAEDGRRLAGELRTLVASMDANLPILSSTTLEHAAALALLPQRTASIVSAGLGAVGLLLTAMGIYGVAAFAVSQRIREIGIRMALGAQSRDVVRLVLTGAARLTFGGAALGLGVAFLAHVALTRIISDFPAIDPLAFAGAALLLAAFAVAACYVPARRALDLDPLATLRAE